MSVQLTPEELLSRVLSLFYFAEGHDWRLPLTLRTVLGIRHDCCRKADLHPAFHGYLLHHFKDCLCLFIKHWLTVCVCFWVLCSVYCVSFRESVLSPVRHHPDHRSFVVSLEIWKHASSYSALPFQDCFDSLRVFCAFIQIVTVFFCCCSSFVKNDIGNLVGLHWICRLLWVV